MPEGISNNLDSYKFQNPQLQAYDADGNGELSVFEIDNISDENGMEILFTEFSKTSKQDQTTGLEEQLESVKNEQGIISNIWNGIKCLTGIGSSTNKCEKAIEDFKSGKISYEEASSIISGFQTKQKSSVNLVSNIATGIAAVAVVAVIVVVIVLGKKKK